MFAVLFATLVLLSTLLAGIAFGHGSAIDPASRHYGCWERWGGDFQNPAMAQVDPMCWQAIQANPNVIWNWNGLYREGVAGNHEGVIADGELCSGGETDPRYVSLDEPGPWTATQLNNNFTLTYHDAANHGADYYRVYVTEQGFDPLTEELGWGDLELVEETGVLAPGAGSPNPSGGTNVEIDVSAPGRTGRHIVYTVWQASHLDQSFYACSDVIFPGGSPDPDPDPDPGPDPDPDPGPDPDPDPGPEPSGACSASYSQLGSWSGGYQAEVTVTAQEALSGWQVTMQMPAGAAVGSLWNGQVTGSSGTVSVADVGYNGQLAAGQSTSFGFIGSGSGSGTTVSCTAG